MNTDWRRHRNNWGQVDIFMEADESITAGGFVGGRRLHAAAAVPDWFGSSPEKPFAIFEAREQLSSREATICAGPGWTAPGWSSSR